MFEISDSVRTVRYRKNMFFLCYSQQTQFITPTISGYVKFMVPMVIVQKEIESYF